MAFRAAPNRSATDKENRRPVTGPASKETRRPLSGNSANVPARQDALNKKPAPVTPRPASAGGRQPRQAATAPKAASAPRAPPLTPAQKQLLRTQQQVQDFAEKAPSLEEELAAINAEVDAEKAAADEDEKEAAETAEELSAAVATTLEQFSAKQLVIDTLEAEYKEESASLDAQRAVNAELCKRNIALDRQTRVVQQTLVEAEAALKLLSRSQSELEEELANEYKNCARVKLAAEAKAELCREHYEKIGTQRERLLEVCGATPSEDVMQLLEESKVRMAKVKKDQLFCEQLSPGEGLQVDQVQEQPTTSFRKSVGGTVWEADCD